MQGIAQTPRSDRQLKSCARSLAANAPAHAKDAGYCTDPEIGPTAQELCPKSCGKCPGSCEGCRVLHRPRDRTDSSRAVPEVLRQMPRLMRRMQGIAQTPRSDRQLKSCARSLAANAPAHA